MVETLVMAPKSVTFRRHDHLVSVLFGDFAQPFLQHYIFNVFVSCTRNFPHVFVQSSEQMGLAEPKAVNQIKHPV